ncbi:MAG: hypothetical protein HY228_02190 [Candidatus Yonathbacteria bacterium]|nr:hypothetical protein [Candidatus Yonathbacteria bacterium]
MYKKFIITLITSLTIFAPVSALALSSEIHVTKEGKADVSSAKVMQQAGNTFFARLYWGDAFIRFTIKTNSSTKFLRATGEATTIGEVKEGDLLDVSGELQSQSDTLTINASTIKNSSVQKEQAVLSGTVTALNSSLKQFTLNNKERGFVTVKVATSTQFIKGNRSLDLEHIRIGDRIIKTSGDYDIPSKTFIANSVTTYVDPALYKPRLFIGKLTETPSSIEAITIKVSVSDTPFSVFIGNNTEIMRNSRSTTTIQRFIKGDTIRIYGTRREIDEPIIDAEVVRNTNL